MLEVDAEQEAEYLKGLESEEDERKKKKKKEKPKKEKPKQNVPVKEDNNKTVNDKIANNTISSNITNDLIPEKTTNSEEPDKKGKTEKKKKDAKKKDTGDKKDDGKKKLNKAQLALLKEALKKREEEERAFEEAEQAKIRAEEEAEQQRLEKIRLEEEKKERKRQKEKERKEKLKAEGKLLTKAQKLAREKAVALFESMKQQSLQITSNHVTTNDDGSLAESLQIAPKKRVIYDQRKKRNHTTTKQSKEGDNTNSKELQINKIEDKKEQKDAQNDGALEAKLDDDVESQSETDEKSEEQSESDGIMSDWEVTSSVPSLESADSSNESSSQKQEPSTTHDANDMINQKMEHLTVSTPHHIGISPPDNVTSIKERIELAKFQDIKHWNGALRSPVVCIMGHVDTGKTKLLDKLRNTNVQENEAGGITQQIGATNVPREAICQACSCITNFKESELQIPGFLLIDTPGHESFKNLRSRGTSLCNAAILVVDIMHGLEPQTLESMGLLRDRNVPFLVALNKIDRLHQWKTDPKNDVYTVISNQANNVKLEFEDRLKAVTLQFAEQGVNVCLYHANPDRREYISMVPTSAHSGDGMATLIYQLVQLATNPPNYVKTKETGQYSKREDIHPLAFLPNTVECSVLEVKEITGMGTTLDCILTNGTMTEGDTMIFATIDGAMHTTIKGLLLPQPLKDLRVKNQYVKHKSVQAALGVKVIGRETEGALPGFPLYTTKHLDEIEVLKDQLNAVMKHTLQSIKLADVGVYVQASTIGSLEALLEFLKTSKIPYAGINIGPVHKKDITKASAMLEHNPQYAIVLAFDVKVDRDAQELADSLKIQIFTADIIYHLFDAFMAYQENYKARQKALHRENAIFPCSLKILPEHIFKTRDPIILGVSVESGELRINTPLCVANLKENQVIDIGIVTSIEANHKAMDAAKKGAEICIKIETLPGETPKMYGRHFDSTNQLLSKITRTSIDVLKNYFRDEMTKADWQLVVELKNTLQII